jgi:RNA polymerase sigma-70 factor, ECF subfamily
MKLMMNGTDIGLTRWQSDEASAQLDFEQAFAAHHRLVYRYALGITRQAALAEDVTQEVFVRLHKNLEAAQRGGMLRAWLLRVTVNVARNCLRGRSRSQLRDQIFGMQWLRKSKVDSPDDGLQRQVEIVKTRRALAKLREPLRNGAPLE